MTDELLNIERAGGLIQPEEWRPIPGYEGLYEVSSFGQVRSVERLIIGKDGRRRIFPAKERKLVEAYGYLYVILMDASKQRRFLVHRLVALAFLPNPDNKKCVDHINTIRTDNRVNNLRWVTHLENQKNPITAARLAEPAKAVIRLSPDGSIKEYAMMKDVVKEGFSLSAVCSCCSHHNHFHKGYVWVYKGEELHSYEHYLNAKQEIIDSANNKRRKPLIASNDLETIEFDGQKDAVKHGHDARAIAKCIKTGKTHHGYYWGFK